MRRELLIGVIGLLVTANKAHACSCRAPRTAEDAARQSRAVFVGRVLAVHPFRSPGQITGSQATVRVERRWKGALDTVVVVRTQDASVLCGFRFVVGVTYLVYAGGTTHDALSTTGCSRTARLSDALADAAALGPGEPVPRPAALPQPPPLQVGAPRP